MSGLLSTLCASHYRNRDRELAAGARACSANNRCQRAGEALPCCLMKRVGWLAKGEVVIAIVKRKPFHSR